MKTDTPVYYIFASPGQTRDESPSTVFYRLQGESIATSLCNLFTREYADGSGRPVFHHKAAASISNEEKVLLDESLGWVDVYYDPDREIYDPPPSKHMHFRAQCAVRARAWEELLREQAETCQKNGTQETNGAEKWNPPNTDELPEMPAEDLRNSGLILLMLLAQAYYKMLESTISMASWVAALDLELNQYYFWTLKSITNLLKHHGDLKDFPEPFEPLFPDLYPSTIGDVDWEDGVAPNASSFYALSSNTSIPKGHMIPRKGLPRGYSSSYSGPQLMRPLKVPSHTTRG